MASEEHIRVEALGKLLCDSRRCLRVLETFHPPTYYLPPEDLQLDLLVPVSGGSYCEWKGIASYYDLVVDQGLASERRLRRAAWSYPHPSPAYGALAGWFAVYPALMDGCWLDGEQITPQPGGFYGGWISSKVLGPFKGDPLHPELI
jgi:uncharacterized protein (DUF427 family)